MPFFCTTCYQLIFPFHVLNNQQFVQDIVYYLKEHKQKLDRNRINTNISIFTNSGINGHESQYCTVNEIADKLDEVNNFTILHVNIRSIYAHFCG